MTVAMAMRQKFLIGQLIFHTDEVPTLIKNIFPADNEGKLRKSYAARAWKWRDGSVTDVTDEFFFERFAYALKIREKGTHYLMRCSGLDFWHSIPEVNRNSVEVDDLHLAFSPDEIASILRTRQNPLWLLYQDPSVTSERLHRELEEGVHKGTIDQKFLYLDIESLHSWVELIGRGRYHTYNDCADALETLLRSPIWKTTIGAGTFDSFVDLGVGAGQKDLEIIDSYFRVLPAAHLQFSIVDTSTAMLEAALEFLKRPKERYGRQLRVCPFKANFLNLSLIRSAIRSEGNTAFFVLGSTFGNIRETEFMNSITAVTHPDDLLVIGVEFYEPTKGPDAIAAAVNQFDDEALKNLAVSPVRLLSPSDLSDVRKTVRVSASKPGQFSALDQAIAIVISLQWRHTPLIVAYSNRYVEEEFLAFVQRHGFTHKGTFSAARNANYRHVVFQKT